MRIDLNRLERIAEPMGRLFYAAMFFALLMAIVGSPGFAFLLLIVGACAHVVRASALEFSDGAERPERYRASTRSTSASARVSPRAESTAAPARRLRPSNSIGQAITKQSSSAWTGARSSAR